MSFQDIESGVPPPRFGNKNNADDPSKGVAAGVFQMNTAVSSFKLLMNTLGTPKDTPFLRERLHKTRQRIGQLAKETAAKLKDASEDDHAKNVSTSKKLSDAKLAKDFQAVLKDFQKTQRIAADRETAFAPFDAPPTQNGSMTSKQEINLNLENELVYNEAIIEEREQGILEIQQQIGEVNEIFKDLAVLVNEQGVLIDDIENNIETSHGHITTANKQLTKAAKSQRSANTFVSLSYLELYSLCPVV
eukprot:jgi/Mesen1/10691/ME000009S10473